VRGFVNLGECVRALVRLSTDRSLCCAHPLSNTKTTTRLTVQGHGNTLGPKRVMSGQQAVRRGLGTKRVAGNPELGRNRSIGRKED